MINQPKTTLSLGKEAETLAVNYLIKQGLTAISQNYHCRFGEIDLIMRDASSLIFIEVKYRRQPSFQRALAAITPSKQRKLKLTAMHYLQQHHVMRQMPCRFDALAMEGDLSHVRYEWVKNILQ